ncbi:hypothetical protein AHMF7605_01795 [Adhaeribacter arboris]|uniref:Uncharacterized protein n=1 Tax=Adhaeribacter arboris TaxID=2072846 RepID=A0A2T2YA15_9BACT|nr:hypothetical protein [Adhaeribacter arboris]PSR52343.1 hypothetical protein AHMF7605_01795 [Adhaeribacter arboris]
MQASARNLYGLASSGGANNASTISRIFTAGSFKVLRHFNLNTDGGTPLGSLLVHKVSPLLAKYAKKRTEEVLL